MDWLRVILDLLIKKEKEKEESWEPVPLHIIDEPPDYIEEEEEKKEESPNVIIIDL